VVFPVTDSAQLLLELQAQVDRLTRLVLWLLDHSGHYQPSEIVRLRQELQHAADLLKR